MIQHGARIEAPLARGAGCWCRQRPGRPFVLLPGQVRCRCDEAADPASARLLFRPGERARRPALFLWGTLGQLPLACLAAVALSWLSARLEGGGQDRSFNLTVTGETMEPDKISVRQGDRLTLTFTIDKKEEVHIHRYDISFEAEKDGDQVTKTFTADKTGSFEIEIENTKKEIGSLEVSPR